MPAVVEPEASHTDKELELAAAYSELQNLLIESSDVTEFLQKLALLSVKLAPGSSCGLTMRRDQKLAIVAHSDDLAESLDEIQHGRGQGPCLQALHTGMRVDVPDLATEQRWPEYRSHALAYGIASSVSLPLCVDGETVGALNLFSRRPHAFSTAKIAMLDDYAQQASTALALVQRQARQRQVQAELAESLATRAVIDQALGIVMAERKITSTAAFVILREASQNSNRKLSDIATDIIKAVTGHSPEPPRPLTHRDGSAQTK